MDATWEKERDSFRVDDIMCLKTRKLSKDDLPYTKSRVLTGFSLEAPDTGPVGETPQPELWKMLVTMNKKLDQIMEKLSLESEKFIAVENRQVNMSESGMRFSVDERLEEGDVIEIKMILPEYPPVGILTYGKVVRVSQSGASRYDIAVQFLESDTNSRVKDEIVKYLLKRQREILAGKRK